MKTIAVIDDDIHIGNFLEELLRQEGYEVLRAYSGTEAVLLLERHRPDLVLLALSETLGSRLRADGAKVSVVSVGIRYADLSYFSHQRALVSPTDLTLEIYHAARELFPELWDGRPIRHLGVHTGGASHGACGRQMSLFDEIDYEKLAVVDRTVDALRQRFGRDSVKRAPFLNTPVSHMCGGVGA